MRLKSRECGLTLVEVMVALAVFSMVVGGVFSVTSEVSRFSENSDTHHLPSAPI